MIRPALSLVVVALLGCASTPTPAPTTPPPAETPAASTEAPTPTEAPVASTETPAATPEPAAPAATPEPTPAAPAGPDVALGRAAFQRVCMSCHEEGDREGPRPGLNWPEARIRTLIRNGNRRMRPVTTARLSDADLEHLIAHLRATRVIR